MMSVSTMPRLDGFHGDVDIDNNVGFDNDADVDFENDTSMVSKTMLMSIND